MSTPTRYEVRQSLLDRYGRIFARAVECGLDVGSCGPLDATAADFIFAMEIDRLTALVEGRAYFSVENPGAGGVP